MKIFKIQLLWIFSLEFLSCSANPATSQPMAVDASENNAQAKTTGKASRKKKNALKNKEAVDQPTKKRRYLYIEADGRQHNEIPKEILEHPDEISAFSIKNNNLEKLSKKEFDALKTLIGFNASNNKISFISEAIGGLRELRKLYIEHNNLRSIPKSIGRCMLLTTLCLSGNKLESLPSEIISLDQLAVLDLSDNYIKTVPPPILGLQSLEILYLDNNLICEVPDGIGNLGNLQFLSLKNNHITVLPESIGNLKKLGYLILIQNSLKGLPESLKTIPNLLEIALDNNRCTDFPEILANCASLESLDISNNCLRSMPHAIGQLCNLTHLIVSDNYITTANDLEFSNLKKLQHFTIDHNRLSEFPAGLSKAKKLTTLQASFNESFILPNDFGDLAHLTEIHLQSNSLYTLPKSFKNLNKLKILNLNSNWFQSIPDCLLSLKSLESLHMCENRIREIPVRLYYLQSLKELCLDDNLIAVFPDFSDKVDLSELNSSQSIDKVIVSNPKTTLSENHADEGMPIYEGTNKGITGQPSRTPGIISLELISLSNNRIDMISGSVELFKSLKVLRLSNNFIIDLPRTILSLKDTLELIDLKGNRLLDEEQCYKVIELGLKLENKLLEGHRGTNIYEIQRLIESARRGSLKIDEQKKAFGDRLIFSNANARLSEFYEYSFKTLKKCWNFDLLRKLNRELFVIKNIYVFEDALRGFRNISKLYNFTDTEFASIETFIKKIYDRLDNSIPMLLKSTLRSHFSKTLVEVSETFSTANQPIRKKRQVLQACKATMLELVSKTTKTDILEVEMHDINRFPCKIRDDNLASWAYSAISSLKDNVFDDLCLKSGIAIPLDQIKYEIRNELCLKYDPEAIDKNERFTENHVDLILEFYAHFTVESCVEALRIEMNKNVARMPPLDPKKLIRESELSNELRESIAGGLLDCTKTQMKGIRSEGVEKFLVELRLLILSE